MEERDTDTIVNRAKRSIINGEQLPSQKFLEMQNKMKKLEEPSMNKSRITID